MKRLSDQTLYEILEVPFDAGSADIEAAIERARALFGPSSLVAYTLMTPEDAALLMSRLEEAKRTLLDPDARNRYDDALTAPPPAPAGANGVAGPRLAEEPPVLAAPDPEPEREPENEAENEAAAEPLSGAQAVEPPADAPEPARAAEIAEAPPAETPAPAPPAPPPTAEASAAPTAPAPIRLERAISPAALTPPAATPIPAATPVPTATPIPAATPVPAPSVIEIPLPEGALWTGEALRKVREARGISVGQIAERTKVTRHHVENIEAERFSALPAPVYLRGILLSMARELRLDGQKVARAYLERAASAARDGKSR